MQKEGLHTRVVALLDTMWDWEGQTSAAGVAIAPRFFVINPRNRSGRILNLLIPPGSRLLVTESCRYLADKSTGHGIPDPQWVAENLRLLDPDVLLVCGVVAKATFKRSPYKTYARILFIPHPAWRSWSHESLRAVRDKILA